MEKWKTVSIVEFVGKQIDFYAKCLVDQQVTEKMRMKIILKYNLMYLSGVITYIIKLYYGRNIQ